VSRPTRKVRARVLLERIKRGPSLVSLVSPDTDGRMISEGEAERRVRCWLSSWIEPDVLALVPELREPKRKAGAA
jgi:hypothetical protein